MDSRDYRDYSEGRVNRESRSNGGYRDYGAYGGYDGYPSQPVRRRKKKKRRGGAVTAVLFILCITLLIIIGMLVAIRLKESKTPIYEYVSMTDEAAAKAYVWLSQIENTDITYDEVKSCMGEFNLELIKTPTKKRGVYFREIADGAYEYCESQARVGFEKAYRLAVMKRLRNSGYEGDINEGLVDELMMEAYEVSVSDYLKGREVAVFPSLQEISSRYEGEVSNEKAE